MQKKQIRVKDVVNKEYKNVELTVSQIVTANEPLTILAHTKVNVIVGFKIAQAINKLDQITTDFYKARTDILNSLGKLITDESGRQKYDFEEGQEAIAAEEINLLLDEKKTISLVPLKLSELAGVDLEPRIMAILSWFIIE